MASSLPKALAALGHDVRLVTPLYRAIHRARYGLRPTRLVFPVAVGALTYDVRVWESLLPGSPVRVYFVECPPLFDREGLYQLRGVDYPDNLERFSLLAQAALQLPQRLDWTPEILHAHDWQAALACAHLRYGARERLPAWRQAASVFTIHNLAYQGVFPASQWALTQLPPQALALEGLEFYSQLNCLKGGLMGAEALTTVSPTYAREIQTAAFGCGLEGVLQQRRGALTGILNGIDTAVWNPAQDPHLPARYTAAHLAGKAVCKQHLQHTLGLPVQRALVIGMIQRLVEQKGIEILLAALPALMALPLQLIILGSGEPRFHQSLQQHAKRYPGRLSVQLTFDEGLAHRIEAGADAFLMPSRFEPCGLNQMYSMRYGTVPIVKRVGGLADTVTNVSLRTRRAGTATGFVFTEHSAPALIRGVRRALAAYQHPSVWGGLVRAGMRRDCSWRQSAQAYAAVYAQARQPR